MNSIIFEYFDEDKICGFRFLKSKNNQICGDDNIIGQNQNYSYIINCDGVSSSSSPDKSSRLLISKFQTHFKSLVSKKPRLGKITEILVKANKEFLKNDLASTFDLFIFSKKFNYYLGLGDSSFYIFDPEGNVIFQNWIHNQSKIIEDHFGSKLGADNVLVNCIGIHHPRFEIAENIKLSKHSNIIFHSDGIEQFFDSPDKIRNYCLKLFENKSKTIEDIKNEVNEYFDKNQDDLSLIFCKTKD